jgi:hypothetical protein
MSFVFALKTISGHTKQQSIAPRKYITPNTEPITQTTNMRGITMTSNNTELNISRSAIIHSIQRNMISRVSGPITGCGSCGR